MLRTRFAPNSRRNLLKYRFDRYRYGIAVNRLAVPTGHLQLHRNAVAEDRGRMTRHRLYSTYIGNDTPNFDRDLPRIDLTSGTEASAPKYDVISRLSRMCRYPEIPRHRKF